ncbi:MAG: N-acylneuraminate cytidylyltransferase [Omnitrophica bacterium GWA2_52_8]|nr:MAG: N-acylneuraminate cytidylyltransferase [Omnitrophica bacterium GWA2_52_8]
MIAIIPARAGSKGLPNKNIKKLLGRPLIEYTIDAAKKARSIKRIILSTDSAEIAALSKRQGVEVPFMRPARLATDRALSLDVFLYTLDRLMASEKVEMPDFVVLQPTSPLRTAADIDAAVRIYRAKKANAVISVMAMNHPVEWVKKVDGQGRLSAAISGKTGAVNNRQKYGTSYVPNGAVYVFNRVFLKRNRRYDSNKTYAYVMPASRSVDIDTADDFYYAEYLLRRGSAGSEAPGT